MTPAPTLSRRVLGALLLAAAARPVAAEPDPPPPWPRRQVRLMTCPTDRRSEAMARTVAAAFASRWRQPVIVDRRSADAGAAAAVQAFLAARDDHVLLLAPTDAWTTPSMPGSPSADPARDLLPLAPIAQEAIVLAAAATSGLRTLDEVFEAARRRPGAVVWTSASPSPAFAFASVAQAERGRLAFAPARTTMSLLLDLSEGRLDLALLSRPLALEAVRTGKIRLLAVAGTERLPDAPAVPTVAEAGYPALMTMSGHGLFGARTQPLAQRIRIGDGAAALVRDPVVAERLTRMGYRPWRDSPAVFAAQLQHEHARWSEIDQPAANVTAAQ